MWRLNQAYFTRLALIYRVDLVHIETNLDKFVYNKSALHLAFRTLFYTPYKKGALVHPGTKILSSKKHFFLKSLWNISQALKFYKILVQSAGTRVTRVNRKTQEIDFSFKAVLRPHTPFKFV